MGHATHPLLSVKASARSPASPLCIDALSPLEADAVRSAESARAIILAMRKEEKIAMEGSYAEYAAKKEVTTMYVQALRAIIAEPW